MCVSTSTGSSFDCFPEYHDLRERESQNDFVKVVIIKIIVFNVQKLVGSNEARDMAMSKLVSKITLP